MASSFSKDFDFAVSQLSTTVPLTDATAKAYRNFVDTFGTHVPVDVTLGGVATEVSSFVDAELDLIHASSASVLASGAVKTFLLSFGAQASASLEEDTRFIFNASRQDHHTLCRPLCPPFDKLSETDSSKWADSLLLPSTNAVPIQVRSTESFVSILFFMCWFSCQCMVLWPVHASLACACFSCLCMVLFACACFSCLCMLCTRTRGSHHNLVFVCRFPLCFAHCARCASLICGDPTRQHTASRGYWKPSNFPSLHPRQTVPTNAMVLTASPSVLKQYRQRAIRV
jgi:hypothetical protein